MRTDFVFLVCLLLLAVLQTGSCLKCYVCISEANVQVCRDPFDKKQYQYDECLIPKAMCVKERLFARENITDNVVRSCTSDPKYCENELNKSPYCSVCSEDYCNSSEIRLPYSFFILTPLVTLLRQLLL